MISTLEIERLAKMPGVNKTAVENFLISLSGNEADDRANAASDARLYKWDVRTLSALYVGISINYGGRHIEPRTTETTDEDGTIQHKQYYGPEETK